MHKPGRTFFLVSSILYLIALTQETFHISGGNPAAWSNGFANLTAGIFSGQPSWLANPLIFIAWPMLYHQSKFSIVPAVPAFALCLQFLSVDEIITSEAGHSSAITGYYGGYWLWLASAAMCVAGACVLIFRRKADSKIEVE